MTLGKKLTLTFVGVSLLIVLLSAVTLGAIVGLRSEIEKSSSVTARKAMLCGDMQSTMSKMRAAVRGIILYSLLEKTDVAGRCAKEFSKYTDNLMSDSTEMGSLDVGENEKQGIAQVRSAAQEWQPVVEDIKTLCARKEFGAPMTAATLRSLSFTDRLEKSTSSLAKQQSESFAASVLAARQSSSRALWLAVAVVLFTLMGCAGGMVVVLRSTGILREVTASLNEGSGQVLAVARQMSQSSTSLAQTASEQAAVVEETSAAATQIATLAGRNADNAQQTMNLMTQSSAQVHKANSDLEHTSQAMGQITESSQSIAKIIRTIDEIAFQTNILALNAAVESARAGEAGMGFAVVADEVRNLAHRSAGAAKETADLISNAGTRTGDGAASLDKLGMAVTSLTQLTQQVEAVIQNVLTDSKEQARGLDQVRHAMSQLERTSQSCAAGAEESSAGGEQLHAQAEEFASQVRRMKQLIG